MFCDLPVCEHDDMKMQRGVLRAQRLQKSRAAHDKTKSEWHVAIARQQLCKPHRAARVSQRTRLASGLVESGADMPSISQGVIGKKRDCRKPSVSALVKSEVPDLTLNLQEDSSDDCACEQSKAPLGWSVFFSRISARKLRPLRRRNKSNSDLELTPATATVRPLMKKNKANADLGLTPSTCVDGSPCDSCLDTTAGETTASDHSDSADETKDGSPPQHVEAPTSESDDTKLAAADSSHPEAKRKIIFRDIIGKLREETHEAQQAAISAEKRAQEAQKRMTTSEDSLSAQRKKLAMQSERQRSIDQRKKRNQAVYLQGVQAKADKALLEANAIKDKAEMEAAEIRARAAADAQVDMSARKQLLQQEDELQRQALENAARTNAETELQAQAVLARAERSAQEIKQQASVDAGLQAEVLIQTAKARALEEADAVKASALKHALALRAKVEEQVEAKLEAAKQAEATAQAAAAAAAAAIAEKEAAGKKEAEKQSRLQIAATMKEAKVREQQNAKKQQRLAAQQRNQAAHLQSVKEKAEKALLEANAVKDRAEMEAAEIRAEAAADVSARNQLLQQEEDELQRQALENAARVKAETEHQAQAILTLAERCAHEMKQHASVEAGLQAEVLVQSAKSRALEEADALKASALQHAMALRAKVEEQVQAKLEAAKQAEATAQAAAAAAAATAEKVAAEQKEAERQSRLQTAATMKEAKVREQQHAKQQQRLAAQQRNQAAHLQSVKDKAEQALQEANTIRAQAENDVAEIRAQALVEAQAAAAAEKQALLDAHAEVAELKNEAMKALQEANTIRAKAENDVAEIRAQAVVKAQGVAEKQALLDTHAEVADLRNEVVSTEAAHENVADQSEDWELLPNISIEQCVDTTWDLVVV